MKNPIESSNIVYLQHFFILFSNKFIIKKKYRKELTLKIFGVIVFGPLEEKEAMYGESVMLYFTSGGVTYPVGLLGKLKHRSCL